MNERSMRMVLRITKALADLQRVRIIMMLGAGELCVCRIVEVLGLAPSTVSKHLSVLADADLVVSRKEGRWMYYRLPEDDVDVSVCSALDWLEKILKEDPVVAQDRDRLAAALECKPEELCRKQKNKG